MRSRLPLKSAHQQLKMACDAPARERGWRPLADASEEEWRRRQRTRRAIVAAIKDSPEYLALQASCRPATPDPKDRTTSKRSWETKVQMWRNALKDQSQEQTQLLIAINAELGNRLSSWGRLGARHG